MKKQAARLRRFARCCRSCSINTSCSVGRRATRRAEDGWIDNMGRFIADASREQAADAVAAALAEGIAAGRHRRGDFAGGQRTGAARSGPAEGMGHAEKPVGSVHGDSVGVHASDAANAWRNIARVSNRRNAVASLIVGAFHTAGQSGRLNKDPLPPPSSLTRSPPPRTSRCSISLTRRSRTRTSSGPAPLSLATARSGTASVRCSICCFAMASARTALARREVLPHGERRIRHQPAPPSAGGSWSPWPASPPANTAGPRRDTNRHVSC